MIKKKQFNVKKAKKELDTKWSIFIRNRDGACQKCGSVISGQAAHIFTRGNLSTRWDKGNGVRLCYACHIHWAHRRPVEFTLWIMERIGEKEFETLRRRTQKIANPFGRKEYEKIKKELTELSPV